MKAKDFTNPMKFLYSSIDPFELIRVENHNLQTSWSSSNYLSRSGSMHGIGPIKTGYTHQVVFQNVIPCTRGKTAESIG